MDFTQHLQAAFDDNFAYSDEIGEVSFHVDSRGRSQISYREYPSHDFHNTNMHRGTGAMHNSEILQYDDNQTLAQPADPNFHQLSPNTYATHYDDPVAGSSASSATHDEHLGFDSSVEPESYCDIGDVVGHLAPEHIRWFYKSEHDKKWMEFNGYDSLRIEEKYTELYYKHFNPQLYADYYSPTYQNGSVAEDSDASHVEPKPEESGPKDSGLGDKVVVRGGLYEVDLHTWKCISTYWPGEDVDVTRGGWFYIDTWQPVEFEEAAKLEEEHLKCFGGHNIKEYVCDTPSRAARPVLLTVPFSRFHVDWLSPNEIYLYHETTSSKLVRSVSQKLGFQKPNGYGLRRGYKTAASLDDKPTDISHLVFVIHGIGQKMDTGRIVRNCSTFRDTVSWLKQKYFPTLDDTERAEFFPVEWRSVLKLDGDIVESITPLKVLGLRQMLNATAMDIMYYTSPLYRAEIQRVLADELNRLYTTFSQRNPHFVANKGKVSVLAHSLGCVLLYDIVTGWTPLREAAYLSGMPETEFFSRAQNADSEPKLVFPIENFFCVGCPLSVFLALRWKDPYNPRCRQYILPKSLCKRLFNIFHPSDPVAYRIEPLLAKKYNKIMPVQIHSYHSAAGKSYDQVPKDAQTILATPLKELDLTKSREKEKTNGKDDADISSPKSPSTPSKDKSWSLWNLMRSSRRPESPQIEEEGSSNAQSDASTSAQCEDNETDLEYRIDYVLREGNLIPSSYISALTSHTAYWSNLDAACFILIHLSDALVSPASDASSPVPD